jgi:hypothetical protein
MHGLFLRLLCLVIAAMLPLLSASPAAARGTHFLLEGEGGMGLTDLDMEAARWGVNLGYGGKFKGAPLRFYLLAGWSGSRIAADLETGPSTLDYRTDGNLLTFGPRLYVPVGPNVRLLLECLGGFYWADASFLVNEIERHEVEDSGIAARFGAGIQVRLIEQLSLGLKVERTVTSDPEHDQAAAALVAFPGRTGDLDQVQVLFTAGLHF